MIWYKIVTCYIKISKTTLYYIALKRNWYDKHSLRKWSVLRKIENKEEKEKGIIAWHGDCVGETGRV